MKWVCAVAGLSCQSWLYSIIAMKCAHVEFLHRKIWTRQQLKESSVQALRCEKFWFSQNHWFCPRWAKLTLVWQKRAPRHNQLLKKQSKLWLICKFISGKVTREQWRVFLWKIKNSPEFNPIFLYSFVLPVWMWNPDAKLLLSLFFSTYQQESEPVCFSEYWTIPLKRLLKSHMLGCGICR